MPRMVLGLIIVLACFFQGCSDIAMTGAQVVYNRRSIQNNLTDHYLTREAYQALYLRSDQFKDTHIAIASYNGDILLAGQAPNEEKKTQAEHLVKQIPQAKTVYNLISVTHPTSTMTRMSDAWLTTKVKAKLLASSEVDATRVKVVTENGTVYLMGILPKEEAQAAATIASLTEGVQRVVKVFSYLTISKV
ncbi:MAG: BON domain-containing protein [Gammaproteobacteria bacterium]|nr:BON domain-containing protein [Gammaproteobacteria bacterium]